MDYKLLPHNWVIERVFDREDFPEKPCRYAVSLRNTKTTEAVFAYGDTEDEAFLAAVDVAKDMRVE